MRTLPLLVIALAAIACGAGADSGYAGSYVTTAETENATGCTGAENTIPILPGDQYFQLADDNLFGVAIVGWHSCTNATSCDMSFDLFKSFGSQGGGVWSAVSYSSSSSGTMGCNWQYHQSLLTRIDGTTIMVEGKSYAQSDPNAATSLCTTDEAKRRGTSMPCVTRTTQTAKLQ